MGAEWPQRVGGRLSSHRRGNGLIKHCLPKRFAQSYDPLLGTCWYVTISTSKNDWEIAPYVRDLVGQLRSSHLRHSLIGDDKVDVLMLPNKSKGLLAGTSFQNLMPQILKQCRRVHQDKEVVVDHQDFQPPSKG